MKKQLMPAVIALATLSVGVTSTVFAGDMQGSEAGMPEAGKQVIDWNAKKIEMQNKSTEMRKQKYAEYKAKGYNMSSMTDDLLDASKTDEGKFWNQLKIIINEYELPMRKERVEEAKKYGVDTSIFTDEVMNDSGKFWTVWKQAVEAKKQEMKKQEMNNGAQNSSDKYAKPYPVESSDKYAKPYPANPTYKEPIEGKPAEYKPSDTKPKDQWNSSGNSNEARPPMNNMGNKSMNNWNQSGPAMQQPGSQAMNMQQNTQQVKALTNAARKKYIKTLEAVSDEKREATYESMKKKLLKQMEVAKKKKQKKTYLKLVEMDQLLEEYLGEEEMDDDSLVDEMSK